MEAAPIAPPSHALDGKIVPADLVAPTFAALGSIAEGGPVYGAGEPSTWVALDGTWYVAFPGCDAGFYLVPVPTQDSCDHGLVYRSDDDGQSWLRLNSEGDGRYTPDGPAANGDADVAVDAAGVLYASNLGGGIQVHKSADRGGNWTYVGDVVPDSEGADRQWMAAGAPGHLIMTWMRTFPSRDVAITTTFDGGNNWTENVAFGNGIGWLGTVQISPDGRHAYIPYTQPLSGGPNVVLYQSKEFAMHVIRTNNGGETWEDIDTGARWISNFQGGHWSGTNMAPALDVTGDGTVVVAWSQDVNSPGDATSQGATIQVITSKNNGRNWTDARKVSTVPTAIQPWVTGGAGERFAVTYYASQVALDADYSGATWDVLATIVGGNESVTGTIDTAIHEGPICSRGGSCLLTGSDRALLDFFESDLTPDGRLVVTYPADPVQGGKYIEIRVAVQNGGSLLAVPAIGATQSG